MTPLRLCTAAHVGDPAFDTALTRAILLRVSRRELPPTVRLYVPGRIVAFGKRDTTSAGYARAIAAATSAGFASVERLAGGRAAVFHERTLAFSWARADVDPGSGIEQRFDQWAELTVAACATLGLDAVVGEVPGEYCPGTHSVAVGGRKVMGVGQRLIRGASHVGGVVVAEDRDLVNAAVGPVYDALDLPVDLAATGAMGVHVERVRDAYVEVLARDHALSQWEPDAATVALAESLAPDHRPTRG